MSTGTRLAGLLLISTALSDPELVVAQGVDARTAGDAEAEVPVEEADISLPGAAIVVTGQRR
ncbi:MAG TPA: hypothetical protein VFS87_04245, partial [Qipengyuania sp.]|nr:hypothetical protein [Qipengyuania sp.]